MLNVLGRKIQHNTKYSYWINKVSLLYDFPIGFSVTELLLCFGFAIGFFDPASILINPLPGSDPSQEQEQVSCPVIGFLP